MQLKRSLGMISYYCLHISNFAQQSAPMFAAHEHFIWSEALENAFTALKAALAYWLIEVTV